MKAKKELEQQIEDLALKLSGLKPCFDREEEQYYSSGSVQKYDLTKQVAVSKEAKEYHTDGMYSEHEMHLNMQYYMEHCERNGYVTPMDWIKNHKHF